ncbi:hypothetical protein [uncultured Treponema sp.]|uniref:hypothetical protein n=1 Tax=uncultured Treponema sp. TaxID=162155 RepID=UPI000E7D8F04|nr:hypothetical protein [uncultured Treponema sp.]HAZ96937.1 hypothetical protein [Treponema sp.]
MKALKKICTALMLLAFAFVFASCSSGSDDDDDNGSVGENVLAGNSYRYSKTDDDGTKTVTYAFKDDTVTETRVEKETGESEETEITEYNYTYDADKGLLYLKVVSWTCDGTKMTSMNDVYKFFVNEGYGSTVEEAKEFFGDEDMFAEKTTMCYFVKDNGNILLGNYFDDDEDVKNSNFQCATETTIRVKFDSEKIEINGATKEDWKIELDASAKTFSGNEIAGSYAVKAKATKTLKELNGDDRRNKANGYITINFSMLPSTLSSDSYNMKKGTDYEFIFDLDCDEYKKL